MEQVKKGRVAGREKRWEKGRETGQVKGQVKGREEGREEVPRGSTEKRREQNIVGGVEKRPKWRTGEGGVGETDDGKEEGGRWSIGV